MVRKYFGTDGIRGRANGVITPELALKVGQAAGLVFQRGDLVAELAGPELSPANLLAAASAGAGRPPRSVPSRSPFGADHAVA